MRTGNNTTNNRQQRVVRYAYYYNNQVCQVFFFFIKSPTCQLCRSVLQITSPNPNCVFRNRHLIRIHKQVFRTRKNERAAPFPNAFDTTDQSNILVSIDRMGRFDSTTVIYFFSFFPVATINTELYIFFTN